MKIQEVEEEAVLSEEEEEEVDDEEHSDEEGDDDDDDDDENEEGKKVTYNDQDGMKAKLEQIKVNLDWVEHLEVTMKEQITLPATNTNKEATVTTGQAKEQAKDDFQREMLFYCQAQTAAREALSKLQGLAIPTQRPEDYFAEMVKSDVHMQKIRKKLLERKDKMELSEKAKRQRQLKKVGKKIQNEVLQKRQQEKKKMLSDVDRMKKGKSQKLYGAGDDVAESFDVSTESKAQGKKRKRKDDKFGYGGRKRKMKKNSAGSTADMTSFKSDIHGKARRNNKPAAGSAAGKRKSKTMNHNKKKGKR